MDFFVGLIEGSDGDASFFINAWAYASHPGEAVHKMLGAARRNAINGPILVNLDYADHDEPPEGAVPVPEADAYLEDTEYSFPTELSYQMPHGVIPTGEQSEIDIDDIRPGWETWESESGLIHIEAVVEEAQLLGIYLSLVAVIPEIRAFSVKLAEDWEEVESSEIYYNEELNSVSLIESFLTERRNDTLLNGHLTLMTYSDEGQTNLNISDHKMIHLMTYEKDIAIEVRKILHQNNVPENEELLSIANGVHHLHYRHPDGLGRSDLIRMLLDTGFYKWDVEVT